MDTSGDGDKGRRAGRRARAATSQYSCCIEKYTDVVLSAPFLQRLAMTIAIALMLGARDHFLIFVSQDWAVELMSTELSNSSHFNLHNRRPDGATN